MSEIRQVYDVKNHPRKYGAPTELEKMVVAMETRFKKIYEDDFIDTYGSFFWGFKTDKGKRFFVNGVYEWNAVFLEYDDGGDGDRVFMDEVENEEQVFQTLMAELNDD